MTIIVGYVAQKVESLQGKEPVFVLHIQFKFKHSEFMNSIICEVSTRAAFDKVKIGDRWMLRPDLAP